MITESVNVTSDGEHIRVYMGTNIHQSTNTIINYIKQQSHVIKRLTFDRCVRANDIYAILLLCHNHIYDKLEELTILQCDVHPIYQTCRYLRTCRQLTRLTLYDMRIEYGYFIKYKSNLLLEALKENQSLRYLDMRKMKYYPFDILMYLKKHPTIETVILDSHPWNTDALVCINEPRRKHRQLCLYKIHYLSSTMLPPEMIHKIIQYMITLPYCTLVEK